MNTWAHKESCPDCGADAIFKYTAVSTEDPGGDRGPKDVACTNAECHNYVPPDHQHEPAG
jgi:hypothetical protein